MKNKKRIPIIEYPQNDRVRKKYSGKEVFLSELEIVSYTKNRYAIAVWEPDADQSEPHFHIIDTETLGNKVNAAYSMITGKFIKHGSVIEPVSNNILGIIPRMLKFKRSDYSRWQNLIFEWNVGNKSGIKILESALIPKFSN